MDSLREAFTLEGASIVVTGAAHGGLGFFSALGLADLGARLVVSDHPAHDAELQRTVEQIRARGGRCSARVCDVTSEEEVSTLVRVAVDEYGQLDGLAHHAGAMLRKSAAEMTLEEWNRILSVNLTATWLVNRAAAAAMAQGSGGSIVNTSSIYAEIVGPLPESSYYASKAGVANLTRGLAMEWAPSGVRVNCIGPGVFYPTRMTAPLAEDPGRLDAMAARTLLKRLGRPEQDFAGPVAFLLSKASSYVTGQSLYVDGGWTAS